MASVGDKSPHVINCQEWVGVGVKTVPVLQTLLRSQANPELGKSITAVRVPPTDRPFNDCATCVEQWFLANFFTLEGGPKTQVYCGESCQRINHEFHNQIQWLQDQGVSIVFEKGGALSASMSEDVHAFPRILWNRGDHKGGELPIMIHAFFNSARQVKDPANQIYVTIVRPTLNEESDQQDTVALSDAALRKGYGFQDKRHINVGNQSTTKVFSEYRFTRT